MPFVAGVRWRAGAKDAGNARSSATGATEDAVAGARSVRRRQKLYFVKRSYLDG